MAFKCYLLISYLKINNIVHHFLLSLLFNLVSMGIQCHGPTHLSNLTSCSLHVPVQIYIPAISFFPEPHCSFVCFVSTSKALIPTPAQDKILAFYKFPYSKSYFLYKALPDFLCNFKFNRANACIRKQTYTQGRVVD